MGEVAARNADGQPERLPIASDVLDRLIELEESRLSLEHKSVTLRNRALDVESTEIELHHELTRDSNRRADRLVLLVVCLVAAFASLVLFMAFFGSGEQSARAAVIASEVFQALGVAGVVAIPVVVAALRWWRR